MLDIEILEKHKYIPLDIIEEALVRSMMDYKAPSSTEDLVQMGYLKLLWSVL